MQINITITIKLDDTAFKDEPGEEAWRSIQEKLRKVRNEVEHLRPDTPFESTYTLYTINGTPVGRINMEVTT